MREFNYQQRIEECARRAATAPTEKARALWKWMEEFWRERVGRARQARRTFGELQNIWSPPVQPRLD